MPRPKPATPGPTPAERSAASRKARGIRTVDVSADTLAALDALGRRWGLRTRPEVIARLVTHAGA